MKRMSYDRVFRMKGLMVNALLLGLLLGALALFLFPSEQDRAGGDPKGLYAESRALGESLFTSTDLGTNGKSCNTCHKNMKLSGIRSKYPGYSEQIGKVVTLSEQINYMIKTNLKGTPLKLGDEKLTALNVYLSER